MYAAIANERTISCSYHQPHLQKKAAGHGCPTALPSHFYDAACMDESITSYFNACTASASAPVIPARSCNAGGTM